MRLFLFLVLLIQLLMPITGDCMGKNLLYSRDSYQNQTNTLKNDSLNQSEKNDYPDSLKRYEEYKRIIINADSSFSPYQITQAYLHLADYYYSTGGLGEAYRYYSQGGQIADEHSFQREKAISLAGMGHIDWRTGDNIGSISNILESIRIFTILNDTTELINASDILAGVYTSMSKLDDAEKIYDNMLSIALKSDDSLRIAQLYEHKGVIHFFREDYDGAIKYYSESQKINSSYGNEVPLGINYSNIAEAYDFKGEYKKAFDYFDKAFALMNKHDFKSGLIFVYYARGRCYMHKGNYEVALRNYRQSLEIMGETGERREMPLVLDLIANNYELQGDFKKAYEFKRKSDFAKDSVENLEKNKQVEEIKARYEVDKKEKLNEELIKENEDKLKDIENKKRMIFFQFILVSLLFLLIVLLVYLYFKINTQKKQLKKANDTKNKLLSIIGHDLRGPVGNLKGITEIVVKDDSMSIDPYLKTLFTSLNDSINSAYFLLNDLLTWSQLQKEGLKFNFEELNAREQVDKVMRLFEYNADNKHIEISNHVESGVLVKADENALQTVIRNLVSNAIKFTPENGKVEITSEYVKSDRYVKILIKDTGIGIEANKLKKIFKSESLGVTYGTSNETGRGIGLSICKEFVERGGGKIGITSEQGMGSTFFFTIPLYKS